MSPQHSPWLHHSLQHFLLACLTAASWIASQLQLSAAELPLPTAELQLSAATWACTSRVFACLGDSITDGTLHIEILSPSLLSLVAMATTSLRT
ncbi:hypothetical protein XELAEV_18010197mg [Xenopus laevis]|uniref:Secreted protein n=1 Tax=Xenopus laevis TaxID=8355 RepID=A0A974I1A1_XENLA|nr:hypothetical protein XELAEV_18010197mg [Xenopus laevis]